MLLNRLQLALDDIDLAAGCRLCIFGNPLGGARRGARHLMREAIACHQSLSLRCGAVEQASQQASMQVLTTAPWSKPPNKAACQPAKKPVCYSAGQSTNQSLNLPAS